MLRVIKKEKNIRFFTNINDQPNQIPNLDYCCLDHSRKQPGTVQSKANTKADRKTVLWPVDRQANNEAFGHIIQGRLCINYRLDKQISKAGKRRYL